MRRIFYGGFLSDRRTQIMSAVGVMSAIAAYAVGDSDIFILLQTIFTCCGIYFIRKPKQKNKGQKIGKHSRKISKQ